MILLIEKKIVIFLYFEALGEVPFHEPEVFRFIFEFLYFIFLTYSILSLSAMFFEILTLFSIFLLLADAF